MRHPQIYTHWHSLRITWCTLWMDCMIFSLNFILFSSVSEEYHNCKPMKWQTEYFLTVFKGRADVSSKLPIYTHEQEECLMTWTQETRNIIIRFVW